MKNVKTFEGFFDKFKKKKEPETTSKKEETISVPGNKYYAIKHDGNNGSWFVYSGWGFGGRPLCSIRVLEDGTLIMRHRDKNIKLPSVERGLEYLKELDDEAKKRSNVIDIDLTK